MTTAPAAQPINGASLAQMVETPEIMPYSATYVFSSNPPVSSILVYTCTQQLFKYDPDTTTYVTNMSFSLLRLHLSFVLVGT